MYLLFVTAALLMSAWTILNDYQSGALAAADIAGVAPSYVRQAAIMAALGAILVDFVVATLRDRTQRKRRARAVG